MNIIKLMAEKSKKPNEVKIPTIAFLGDSVTQGCFELYMKAENVYETEFDSEYAYHNCLKKIFSVLFPNVPLNIINAGISGNNSTDGLNRLERDVIAYKPDLTVVCFGLNDNWKGADGIEEYKNNLKTIFTKLKESGSEVICMTANMMCDYVNYRLDRPEFKEIAEGTAKQQNDGRADMYFSAAKEVAAECGVKICDVYSKLKRMNELGIDTTELLSNYINHPKREMHWLFASSLVDAMME